MIDDKLKAAVERALDAGHRVQLKRMKDGSVKARRFLPRLEYPSSPLRGACQSWRPLPPA